MNLEQQECNEKTQTTTKCQLSACNTCLPGNSYYKTL